MAEKKSNKINREFFEAGAEKITENDIHKVGKNESRIREKFKKKGPLRTFIEDAKLLLSAVKDFHTGKYKYFSFRVIAGIVFALLYVLNPIDIIPDMIPILGQIDDALIVALCLILMDSELQEYKTWKENNN